MHRLLLATILMIPLGASAQRAPELPLHEFTTPDAVFPEPFSLILGLRALADGRVLIADFIEERLAALDFEMGTETAIGRVGGGPREYRLPSGLIALPEDETLLIDRGNARLTRIGTNLEFLGSITPRPANSRSSITPKRVDAQGRMYYSIPPWSRPPGSPPSDSIGIARWDPGEEVIEPMGQVLGSKRVQRPNPFEPGYSWLLFGPQDTYDVAPDGRVAFVRADEYQVEWRNVDGGRTRGPVIPFTPVPVTEDDKRAFLLWMAVSTPVSGRGGDGGIGHQPAEWADPDAIARSVQNNVFAETKPPFPAGGAWITTDGELWVQRSRRHDQPPFFDVFDEYGVRIRQVTLPGGRRILGFGPGAVYTELADDDDLKWVERWTY
jgi:hypothetical protein